MGQMKLNITLCLHENWNHFGSLSLSLCLSLCLSLSVSLSLCVSLVSLCVSLSLSLCLTRALESGQYTVLRDGTLSSQSQYRGSMLMVAAPSLSRPMYLVLGSVSASTTAHALDLNASAWIMGPIFG